ncbi:laccase 1 [Rhodocollybia butyracea]|uniref:Laccase 1 n=1 Tax=Rhodocollybia butyracea TaxID=206335 RepID=A0A9P5PS81_9AGAR|nr:laccase 1 [Rhodocollybia butyracea]
MISTLALAFLAPIGALAQSTAIGPVADLHIVNAFIQPDGFNRSYILANGVFPGPPIVGKKGDNFQINVIDELTNGTMLLSTSIPLLRPFGHQHWHGLFQATTNWADGPSFVNQCPIAANNSFLYNFNVPDQAGTFWYHSHLATQYCDGLRGALIIYDPDDPYLDLYDVDDETTIITLADWYHVPSTLGRSDSDATLINGLGRSPSPDSSLTTALAVISVTYGTRYRFRLISTACDPNFNFSIDGHTFSVIEADGIETEPVVADSIQIFAAQRYSFILTANQSVDNYWIRAPGSEGPTGFDNGVNSAILRYAGAPDEEPTTTDTSNNRLQENQSSHSCKSRRNGADYNLNLQLSQTADGRFMINDVQYISPNVPVLLQILSGATSAHDLLPPGSVYNLPLNQTIQITFNATTVAPRNGPHPFHLHGHAFDVVRSAGTTEYNFENPVRRDVVSTGTGLDIDNVTIRFRTDNAGGYYYVLVGRVLFENLNLSDSYPEFNPGFLHCHIDFHLEAGFAIVLAEGANETAAANPVPVAWEDLCPIYDNLTPEQIGGAGGPTS